MINPGKVNSNLIIIDNPKPIELIKINLMKNEFSLVIIISL